MVCRDFILPESANYVFFYAFFFLRNLSYNIEDFWIYQERCIEFILYIVLYFILAVFVLYLPALS